MKQIPDFVTSRIHAQIKELSIGDIIDLCRIPVHLNERGITRALQAIIKEPSLPIQEWTAQERYAAVIHYYINAYYDGHPPSLGSEETQEITILNYLIPTDFPVSKRSKLQETGHTGTRLHYPITLDSESDEPDYLWLLPMNGDCVEALERVVTSGLVRNIKDRAEAWEIAQMAAQILPLNIGYDEIVNTLNKSLDQFISENIEMILGLSLNQFKSLKAEFLKGQEAIDHLVILRANDEGLALEGGSGDIPPLRFQFSTLIPELENFEWAGSYERNGLHAD